jgi:hypothetical protein
MIFLSFSIKNIKQNLADVNSGSVSLSAIRGASTSGAISQDFSTFQNTSSTPKIEPGLSLQQKVI